MHFHENVAQILIFIRIEIDFSSIFAWFGVPKPLQNWLKIYKKYMSLQHFPKNAWHSKIGISLEMFVKNARLGTQKITKNQQKINNNCSKIFEKTALKSMLEVSSILEPTWTSFGRVLGPKMGPSWHQMAQKINVQLDQRNHHILDHTKIATSSI